VLKIETTSDTNLRSLYESWFRNALISKSVILWQGKKGINSEHEGANARRVLNISSKRSLYLMRSSHTSAHLQKKSTCFLSWTSPLSHLPQMLEPPCHLQDSTLKWCARAAAGTQQLYSSSTQARGGTANPLNSKAHIISARGTFDGWVSPRNGLHAPVLRRPIGCGAGSAPAPGSGLFRKKIFGSWLWLAVVTTQQ